MNEPVTQELKPALPGVPNAAAESNIRYRGLRVAVLSDALQYRNGVDAYYRDLVNHLGAHVESISLLTPNAADGDLASDLFHFPLPGDATQNVFLPIPSRLNARIRQLNPNVLVSATNGPFGMYGVYLSHRHRLKLIAGFHTHIEELCQMYWGAMLGRITRAYMESQNRILFRRASSVVVNSHRMLEPARLLSRTPVSLMSTPLDSLFLEHRVSQPGEQLRRIFYGGRLAPEKNITAILEAARQLPQLQFTLAGDGPLRQQIENAAARLPNLHYLGLLERSNMVTQIDAHDLVVLPSHLEAFGTIALEAMVRQRLVLVSSECGILSWQNLARGLCSFRQDESLAAALTRLAALDPRLRQHKAGLARTEALATHHEAVRDWLNLLATPADV
ncbi:MAG: glycosyltransferase [Gammaproteobacteria bacterium]|nr:glycosyltransferase [Pseudomonadales bacterium]MCP5348067.1 glycosyltransferase [Pseudomonadales bacterium]